MLAAVCVGWPIDVATGFQAATNAALAASACVSECWASANSALCGAGLVQPLTDMPPRRVVGVRRGRRRHRLAQVGRERRAARSADTSALLRSWTILVRVVAAFCRAVTLAALSVQPSIDVMAVVIDLRI